MKSFGRKIVRETNVIAFPRKYNYYICLKTLLQSLQLRGCRDELISNRFLAYEPGRITILVVIGAASVSRAAK